MNTEITEATRDYDTTIDLQTEVEDIIREACEKSALDAAKIAGLLITRLKQHWGGDTLYIASGLTLRERARRDKAIRAEYNGRNRAEVCAKYRVSKARLYQILALEI